MDMSVLLGFVGIIVSIAVGIGTYYLTERRARRNRWQSAKETVLHDLSKCLGEDNVPAPAVITATIRSVLRATSSADLEAVTLDEVADDLLRQITSDPFLQAERRSLLQNKVVELKAAHLHEQETHPVPMRERSDSDERLTWSSLVSLIAGLFASLLAAGSVSVVPHIVDFIHDRVVNGPLTLLVPLAGMLLTLLGVVTMWLATTSRNRRHTGRP